MNSKGKQFFWIMLGLTLPFVLFAGESDLVDAIRGLLESMAK